MILRTLPPAAASLATLLFLLGALSLATFSADAFVPLSSSVAARRSSADGVVVSDPARGPLFASESPSPENADDKSQEDEDEASLLRARADALREQIRSMESELGDDRGRSRPAPAVVEAPPEGMSLKDKRVLVVGANGRVGSMVCRHLLRAHPEVREVVAQVHVVGEASTRGWGRLSYEVGAEDGVGSIGPAWSPDDRTASFRWSEDMAGYNLNKLRIVEAELLDPVQTATVTEDVDCVIWCATDFNGNKPRAISGLNVAFLFRAVASPDKGRVEVEGLRNVLGGLKAGKQNRRWKSPSEQSAAAADEPSSSSSSSLDGPNDPLSFVLLSAAADAFDDFETPFGTFRGLKREGEDILTQEYPSLSSAVLQMSRYDDNFVEEGLDVRTEESEGGLKGFDLDAGVDREKFRRRINRRDAARKAVEALVDEGLRGKVVEVWTDTR